MKSFNERTNITAPLGANPYVHLTNEAKENKGLQDAPKRQPLATFTVKSFEAELKVNRGAADPVLLLEQSVEMAKFDSSVQYSNVFSSPRPGRVSRYRSAAVTNAMERAFKAVDTRHWSPAVPVLATFAFRGRKGELRKVARSDEFVNGCWARFMNYYEAGWGVPLEARWFKEFDEDQYPHFHVQFVLPKGRAKHRKGKGCRLGFLDGLEVEDWMEKAWCYASRQSPGRSSDGHGRHAWIPRIDKDEVPRYKSLEEHEKVFVLYARKDCNEEWKAKALYSHRTPHFWIATGNKQVTWYGVTPALARRVKPVRTSIRVFCSLGLRALRDHLHELSGAEREMRDGYNEHTGDVEEYDSSYWSNERRQLRGGVLRRPLSDSEYSEIIRAVSEIEYDHRTNMDHVCD